jgi:hypothetical protein
MLPVALIAAVLATSAAPPHRCTTSHLQLSHGQQQGSAGHFHWSIVFTNTGAHRCTLGGYPGVSSRSRHHHGHQVGQPASQDPGFHPLQTVVLAGNGGQANALFTQVDTGVVQRSACRPRHARGLRVYAPNAVHSQFLHLRHRTCSIGTSSQISAVGPGPGD